jgi:hypothetical protein
VTGCVLGCKCAVIGVIRVIRVTRVIRLGLLGLLLVVLRRFMVQGYAAASYIFQNLKEKN